MLAIAILILVGEALTQLHDRLARLWLEEVGGKAPRWHNLTKIGLMCMDVLTHTMRNIDSRLPHTLRLCLLLKLGTHSC